MSEGFVSELAIFHSRDFLHYTFARLLLNDFSYYDVLINLSVVLAALESHSGKHEVTSLEFLLCLLSERRHHIVAFVLTAKLFEYQLTFLQLTVLTLLTLHRESVAAFHYF